MVRLAGVAAKNASAQQVRIGGPPYGRASPCLHSRACGFGLRRHCAAAGAWGAPLLVA